MRTIQSYLMGLLCLLSWVSQAQSLEVSWDKTTVLIFDSQIQSVDRGSRMLLGQKDDMALNLLKLKAGSRELPPTTLHVLTVDGQIHEFQVQYAENPIKTTWDFRNAEMGRNGLLSKYKMDQAGLDNLAFALADEKNSTLKKANRYAVEMRLKGIYYQDGLLLFDLRLANYSAIPFQISGPEFRIADSKGKKQSTQRDQKLNPWLTSIEKPVVSHMEEQGVMLFAFPSFTIANNKKLLIQLSESQGDRELELRIRGRKLLRAKTIPMFNTKPTSTYGSGEL
jgi:conjugative transposon TraN protein